MRHPLDPRDGWPVVTTAQFVGYVLLAVAIVAFAWVGAVAYLVTFS